MAMAAKMGKRGRKEGKTATWKQGNEQKQAEQKHGETTSLDAEVGVVDHLLKRQRVTLGGYDS